MEDTRRFLEEHCLSVKEVSKVGSDESSGKGGNQCSFDSQQKKRDGLNLSNCITCSEYLHVLNNSTTTHVLLDVRAPHQFAICSLPHALNIPLENLSNRMNELRDKGDIYVMCRRGIASVKATKMLLMNNFTNVKNIDGGLDAWSIEVDTTLPMY